MQLHLSNILSELTSILILFLFLPKNFKINKKDFVPKKENIKDVLNISIPTTGSRIIGNIGYFLEPIILTFVLLRMGYSNEFIVQNMELSVDMLCHCYYYHHFLLWQFHKH